MPYLAGNKILGIDEHWLYCDDTDENYFDDLDTLMEHLQDNRDPDIEGINETFWLKCYKCYQVQYWFPTVKYIKEFLFNDEREPDKIYLFPTLGNIVDEIIQRTDFDEDFEYKNDENDLKGFTELSKAMINYIEDRNDDKLKIALDNFQELNEHWFYYYPKLNEEFMYSFKFNDKKEIEFVEIENKVKANV